MSKLYFWLLPLIFLIAVFCTVWSLSQYSATISKKTILGISPDNGFFQTRTASPKPTVVGATPTPLPTPPPHPKIAFVGDIMLDRHIREKQQEHGGYDRLIDASLSALLLDADLAIGNLEGPVTNNPSKSVGSAVGSPANYSFTFEPASMTVLTAHNFKLVSLGNNHILNFGTQGEASTRTYLQQENINYFGDTGSSESGAAAGSGAEPATNRFIILPIGDTKFAFVNYNQFSPNGYAHALADMAEVQAVSDVQVLYAHWGNEYVPENQTLKNQAAAFVEAGADLIIGSHPHVITGNEVIAETPVFYSLGNFIFDQYFEPAVQEGMVVIATYDPSAKKFSTQTEFVSLGRDGITRLN